jgi:hypothetical protein
MLDQLYRFNGELKTINPKTAEPGVLELHPVDEKGRVFLFDGQRSLEECKAGVKAAAFELAANGNHPAFMKIDANSRIFTIYAEGGMAGYVRIAEC